jgi:hypothetical protein
VPVLGPAVEVQQHQELVVDRAVVQVQEPVLVLEAGPAAVQEAARVAVQA